MYNLLSSSFSPHDQEIAFARVAEEVTSVPQYRREWTTDGESQPGSCPPDAYGQEWMMRWCAYMSCPSCFVSVIGSCLPLSVHYYPYLLSLHPVAVIYRGHIWRRIPAHQPLAEPSSSLVAGLIMRDHASAHHRLSVPK